MYWDVNSLYEWMMSQNLRVDGFQRRKEKFRFHKEFIQEYDENICKGYILEVDVKYNKELCHTHVIHIKDMKQILDHGLILEKSK